MFVLKMLDGIFIAATAVLLLVVAGLPAHWLLNLVDMSLREFQAFVLFVLFGALVLIHAIATSDSAP
jgi:putative Ca2+/H+ antiporter (TMEM165/GDT1 family)